jgi:phosphomevalonate kinase
LSLSRTLESLKKIKPFNKSGITLSDVHKTGLGSSAALITSLVSALLVHFSILPTSAFSEEAKHNDVMKTDVQGKTLAHNLSQYVHCLAQGKVGSGFDVSAAVFGTHLYTRFDPTVLQQLMDDSTVCFI